MLSPYAMWKIQLTDSANENRFGDLLKFKDQIDLELVGAGIYVTKGSDVTNVDEYYEEIFQNSIIVDPANSEVKSRRSRSTSEKKFISSQNYESKFFNWKMISLMSNNNSKIDYVRKNLSETRNKSNNHNSALKIESSSSSINEMLLLGSYVLSYVRKMFGYDGTKQEVVHNKSLQLELAYKVSDSEQSFRSAVTNASKLGWH